MVDQFIDYGLELSPATEWTVLLSHEVAVLLPSRSSHRGVDVVTFDMAQPAVILSDPAGAVGPLYLNLLTGAVGASLDAVGLGSR